MDGQRRGGKLSIDRILDWMEPIRLSSIRLVFQFSAESEFQVSTLRGIWGRGLRGLDEELYRKVFEGEGIPHFKSPRYLIRIAECGIETEPDGAFTVPVDFLTWGVSPAETDFLLRAWKMAPLFGIGKKRILFRLLRGENLYGDGGTAPVSLTQIIRKNGWADRACTIEFKLPLRLVEQKRTLTSPGLADLAKAAVQRISLIREQMKEKKRREEDFLPSGARPDFYQELLDYADTVSAEPWEGSRLMFHRYSGRQKREVDMQGTAGKLTLNEPPGPLAPLLAAAGVIHLGKGTVMGLGRAEVTER